MEDTKVVTLRVGDDELSDAVSAHQMQGMNSILSVADAFGVAGHDVGCREAIERGIGFNHAAQVAVGDNTLYE